MTTKTIRSQIKILILLIGSYFPLNNSGIIIGDDHPKAWTYDLFTKVEKTIELNELDQYEIDQLESFCLDSILENSQILKPQIDNITLYNFSDYTIINNLTESPWCQTVKLHIYFPATFGQGTGIFIDPLHILTAGHNVRDNGRGGWATKIYAYPAIYQDIESNRGTKSRHIYTFYSGDGGSSYSYDYDVAVIQLQRPLGAITGWHTPTYVNNGNFFLNSDFRVVSYFADTHDNYPKVRTGTFDGVEARYNTLFGSWNWYGNELTYRTPPITGSSGSGIAITWDGIDYVVAVLSNSYHSNPSLNLNITNCPRINKTFYQGFSDFMNGDISSLPDLIPMLVEVDTPSQPQNFHLPGQTLESLSFWVCNYSKAVFEDFIIWDVYLSQKDDVLTNEVPLESYIEPITTLTSKQAIRLMDNNPHPPQLPSNLSPGKYYIIIKIARTYPKT